MANRFFNQYNLTLDKGIVSIYARVTFKGASAPVLDATNSKGVVSVTRNGTGIYTFVFGTKNAQGSTLFDTYNRIKYVDACFNTVAVGAGVLPAAPTFSITADSVNTVNVASLQITFTTAGGGSATDPAANEVGLFNFTFSNSNAP